MKFVPRSKLPSATVSESICEESFDSVVVRFADNNFAQDDKKD